jgi:hypothetical protein
MPSFDHLDANSWRQGSLAVVASGHSSGGRFSEAFAAYGVAVLECCTASATRTSSRTPGSPVIRCLENMAGPYRTVSHLGSVPLGVRPPLTSLVSAVGVS